MVNIDMNIICPICNKSFKQITVQHIKKHELTVESFKAIYPNINIGNINASNKSKADALLRATKDNIRCLQCDKLIISNDRKKRRFCSHSCAAIFKNLNKPKIVRKCSICDMELSGKKTYTNGSFCSLKCFHEANYQSYIKKWLNGEVAGHSIDVSHTISKFVRRYLFEIHNNKCEKCGWSCKNEFTHLVPLHMHHKDGNCINTKLDNLELLCPNCHSLTGNFGSRNIGNSKRC